MSRNPGRRTPNITMRTIFGGTALSLVLAGAVLAQSYSFSNVQVNGNKRIEDATILTYAGINRGERVSAAQLNDAVQAIRGTGLFETVDVIPRGGTLVIDVVERPTINRVNFEGNSRLKDEELARITQSKSRKVFTPDQAERDVAAIAKAYADSGRVNAVVQPRIIRRSDNRVDLVFEIAEGGISEIERISFVGNRTFSDRRLRGVMNTKQAGLLRMIVGRDTYVADRLNFDKQVLTDFYRSRGYVDFQVLNVDVNLAEERNGFQITFNVREGQQFRVGDVSLISDRADVDAETFRRAMNLKTGRVYSPSDIENDIARMEKLALKLGVDFLRVEPRITRDDRGLLLNVEYVLSQGPKVFVERIDIEGNTTTLDRVVRNQFTAVEGDPFNPRQIRRSAERIRALGFFSNANVETREGSSPNQVVVDVDVTEQPTGSFSFGANYSSDSGVGLLASFKEKNFLGRGQSLSFGITAGQRNQNYYFNFSEPNVLGRNVQFGFATSYRVTNNEGNADYDTTTGLFKPSLSFPVSDNGRLSVSYSYDYTDITDVKSSLSAIIKREAALGGIGTNSIGYSYSWDTLRSGSRDDDWRVRLQFGQEFGIGKDTQFVRTSASATAQTRVWREDVTLRGTIEGGILHYSKGDSRVTDRYFMGSRVMRGFEAGGIGPRDANTDDALGGNKFAVARLEAEFPLGLPEEYGITGGLFADYGSLWDVGNTNGANVLYDEFTPRAVVGASIFWTTPIGPLRFNFSKAVQSEKYDNTRSFDVTISTSF